LSEASHAIARAFIAALSAGDLPDDLLTADMQAWTVSSGQWSDKTRYQGGVRLLAALFPAGYRFTIDHITAEGDRVAIEAHAAGDFADGTPFANTYVFVLTLAEGRISAVREHFNTLPVREVLGPRVQALLAEGQAA
jgi:ketosteroid isomerase-like protein